MSLHGGVLMVRADVRSEMADVFRSFDYQPVGSQTIASFLETVPLLQYPRSDRPASIVCKAVALVNGWTVVLDDEMIMLTEEDACARLAAHTSQPVFGMVCEGASGTYAFNFFNPDLRRSLWSSDGQVHDQRGTPLPEEQGMDVTDIFETDVLEIMRRLGVDYGAIEHASPFTVWELDESHIQVPAPPENPAPPMRPSKPWWKLW